MKKSFIYLLLAITWVSCTELIDIKTKNSTPVIVIYGSVTSEFSYQTVYVSSSTSYFDTVPNPKISKADVTISSQDGKESWKLKEVSGTGEYRTRQKVVGRIGETYLLRVSCDFNTDSVPELYEASAKVEKPFQIDSIRITSMNAFGNHYYNVLLYAAEPLGPDYYFCRFYINGVLVTPMIKWYATLSDEMFDGSYINGLLIYSFSDKNKQGEYDSDKLLFVESGDLVTVEVNRIDKGYYDFLTQCKKSIDGESFFFGGPPSNIITNLSNGAVGYFTGYSPVRKSAIVP